VRIAPQVHRPFTQGNQQRDRLLATSSAATLATEHARVRIRPRSTGAAGVGNRSMAHMAAAIHSSFKIFSFFFDNSFKILFVSLPIEKGRDFGNKFVQQFLQMYL
jgi:hypothetical protein